MQTTRIKREIEVEMTSSQDTGNVAAQTMQAVVREQYGSPVVLALEEV